MEECGRKHRMGNKEAFRLAEKKDDEGDEVG